jgi:hypothetical protein
MARGGKAAAAIWSTVGLKHAAERARGLVDALSTSATLCDRVNAADFYEDSSVIENADLVYVVCHGTANGPVTDDRTPLDKKRCRWGRGRLRWLALDACRSLAADDPIESWAPCFDGLRLLLGFSNETLDRDEGLRGRILGRYLRSGVPIVKAWQWASQETNPWYSENPERLDWRPSPAWIRRFTDHDDSHEDRWTGEPPALRGDDVEQEHWISYWGVRAIPTTATRGRMGTPETESRGKGARAEGTGVERWWNGSFPKESLHLEPKEAKALADDHFRQQGAFDDLIETARVSLSQTRKRGTNDRDWRTVAWNVTYRFTLRDIPLSGPWGQAEATLALDDNGVTSVVESFRIDDAPNARFGAGETSFSSLRSTL